MLDIDMIKRDLNMEVERCKKIVNLLNSNCICAESVFIEILIRLALVLGKLKTMGHEISWKEDLQSKAEISNISDLVREMRNAACHIESNSRSVDESATKSVFNRIVGNRTNGIKINTVELNCEYDNDVALFYGNLRIYLNRHINKLLDNLPNIINTIS